MVQKDVVSSEPHRMRSRQFTPSSCIAIKAAYMWLQALERSPRTAVEPSNGTAKQCELGGKMKPPLLPARGRCRRWRKLPDDEAMLQ
eukprot:5597762-Amphidinium_carterae.2